MVMGLHAKTVKYKCLAALTLHAFHPKAVNDKYAYWQVFWLTRI